MSPYSPKFITFREETPGKKLPEFDCWGLRAQEDFEYDSELGAYTYPCPCGDQFIITEDELEVSLKSVLKSI